MLHSWLHCATIYLTIAAAGCCWLPRLLQEPNLASSGREGFVQAVSRGCFSDFLAAGRFPAMLQEVEGALQCFDAGSAHYDEARGVDTRLSCLSHWAFGETVETMDSCLLHHNCLALVAADGVSPARPTAQYPELSFERAKACVLDSCAAHLPSAHRLPLAACVAACPLSALSAGERDFACAAKCLAQHSRFSAAGTAMVHCASQQPPPWATGHTTFDGFMATAACLGGQLAPVSTFWAALEQAALCAALG